MDTENGKNPRTYEFYPQGLFGQYRRIEINELSGRHRIIYVAKHELGIEISQETAKEVLNQIKTSYSSAERKEPYSVEEVRALM